MPRSTCKSNFGRSPCQNVRDLTVDSLGRTKWLGDKYLYNNNLSPCWVPLNSTRESRVGLKGCFYFNFMYNDRSFNCIQCYVGQPRYRQIVLISRDSKVQKVCYLF